MSESIWAGYTLAGLAPAEEREQLERWYARRTAEAQGRLAAETAAARAEHDAAVEFARARRARCGARGPVLPQTVERANRQLARVEYEAEMERSHRVQSAGAELRNLLDEYDFARWQIEDVEVSLGLREPRPTYPPPEQRQP